MEEKLIRNLERIMFTVKQLRETAKSMGLIRLSKLRKAELDALVKAKLTGKEIPLQHLKPTVICKQFLNTRFVEWKCENLNFLTVELLKNMCSLKGFKRSGKKSELINRFVTAQALCNVLRQYTKDDIQLLADSYKGRELKEMLKKARTVHKVSVVPVKYAMAAGLISWRDGCLSRGMRFYKECKEQLRVIKERRRQAESQELVAA
ncbi:hypothetical protein NIES267_73510 (plasmid) [Calothrix parasitica NIES-267]|uniref:SAP domain-containing protein n=1 Tax=Calothrix parasitica NIES-267 TaxID=1973488 RepID=A0A1Z4M2X7_9CYAN|nr:hypothetical protein NIES267_73510 [Calothrix parasitica NIES-267]